MDPLSAYARASSNKPALTEKPRKCGCYYCERIFQSDEIKEWIYGDNPADRNGTAICPYCGIDSVIYEREEGDITPGGLHKTHKVMFW